MANKDDEVVEGSEEDLFDDVELEVEGLEGEEDNKPEAKADDKTSTTETPDNEPQLSETEKVAYAQGWRPKKDWIASGGDPKAWKEAAWWLDRGELLGQQSQLRKEIKQVKDAFIRMTEYNRQAYIKGVTDGIERMKHEKRAALREGALDVVADLEDKIDEATETLATVQATKTDPLGDTASTDPKTKAEETANHPAYKAWIAANTWYSSNEDAFDYANAAAARYAAKNPSGDLNAALAHVTEKVKARFPELFSGPKRVSQPSVGGRGVPTSSQSNGAAGNVDSKFAKIVSQMDPDTRRAVVDMVRSGSISKKEYVDSYTD